MGRFRRLTLTGAATALAVSLTGPASAVVSTIPATATVPVTNSEGNVTPNTRFTLSGTDEDVTAGTAKRWEEDKDPDTAAAVPDWGPQLGLRVPFDPGVLRVRYEFGDPATSTAERDEDRLEGYLLGKGLPRDTTSHLLSAGYATGGRTDDGRGVVTLLALDTGGMDPDTWTSLLRLQSAILDGGLVTKLDDGIHSTGADGTTSIGGLTVGGARGIVTSGGYSWALDQPLLEGANHLSSTLWDYGRYVFWGPCIKGPGSIARWPGSDRGEDWWEEAYSRLGPSGPGLAVQSYAFGTTLRQEDLLAANSCTGVQAQRDSTFINSSSRSARPDDPHFASRGSWGQPHADQWALHRIGFTSLDDPRSAWHLTTGTERPVVVAVIDSGIDLTHPDIHPGNLWFNAKEIPGNGRDDDGNGFIDDVIGWNFVQNSNNPYDLVGHGTHVAGLIAARWNNGHGIAGINRGARIMALKAFNEVGRGWGSDIARAIVYAVDNGAQIINISAEHAGESKFLRPAFEYARAKGVLIVVAAGNLSRDTKDVEPANQPAVLVVAATQADDRKAGFSNWGQEVSVAAPGVDVLSLRARRTDLARGTADDPSQVKPEEGVVGADRAYYRAAGTSFSAPLVTGLASLIWAKHPHLTAVQVARMITQSAKDVEEPGWDQFTGYGLVDARAALTADPDWYLEARMARVQPTREGGRTVIRVLGTVTGSALEAYTVELGQGAAPDRWKRVGPEATAAVQDGLLGTIPVSEITARGRWTIRVVARDTTGVRREARATLTVE